MNGKGRKWSFFKSAGLVQVKIETGEDVAHLPELDQKFWTALAAPVAGLRADARMLAFLDTDGDGRIRAPEVLAAVEWLRPRLASFDTLFKRAGAGALNVSEISQSTPEGAKLADEISLIAAASGREDGEADLAAVASAEKAFAARPFNGDGVATAATVADSPDAARAFKAVSSVSTVPDRSGEPGVDKALVESFFKAAADRLAWRAAAGGAYSAFGDVSEAAWTAYSAVAAKIDDFFARCAMAAFDPRAVESLKGDAAALAAVSASNLAVPPPELEAFPLAEVAAGASLPLENGVNPFWAAKIAAFAERCARPALGADLRSIDCAQWDAVKTKIAPYAAWRAAEAGAALAAFTDSELAALLEGGKAQAALEDAIAKDAARAGEYDGIVDAERAVRYASGLAEFLQNFVNQARLYKADGGAIFQTGTLYIDSRSCGLCFHVDSAAAHAALAGKSNCHLLYLKLTRPSGAVKERTVCAAVTAGFARTLWTGRNAVFYDRDGLDWDATVVQIVDAQVSLREAFWSPWIKVGEVVSGQINKILAARESEALAKTSAAAEEATKNVAEGKKPAAAPAPAQPQQNGAAMASSVAAIGIGVGMLGAAFAGIAGFLAGMPWWKVGLCVASAILAVSLPSVLIAWLKLRKRDIGAILNACGWAMNRPLRFPMRLSRVFTRELRVPSSAKCARDPYAPKRTWLWILAALALLAAGAWGCWSYGLFDGFLPDCMRSAPADAACGCGKPAQR